MQADFHDAHDRHWQDAENLRSRGRWANADHLYGLAAECGLKRLMHAFGMQLRADGKPVDERDAKHADQIWGRYDAYRTGHQVGIAYALTAAKNPFADWHVSQRYANASAFDQARTDGHRVGADMVRRLVSRARMDGLI